MSIEFDTARQVVAASVLDECEQPNGTALDSNDFDDVYRALDAVSRDASSEEDKALDGIYTLSIAAVADSRELRLTARRKVSSVCSANGDYFVYMDDADNQRLADDATAEDLAVRAGVVSALRWLTPYASTHALSPDALDALVPAVIDALSADHRMLRRGAALSTVAAYDSDSLRSTYPGEMDDFRQSLVAATRNSDPNVRGHALSVLNCPRPEDDPEGFNTAMDVYLTVLSDDTECNRRTALDALSTTPIARRSSHGDTHTEALEMLPRVIRGLHECLDSSSPVVRRRASEVLWNTSYRFSERPNDENTLTEEIASIGETVAELPPDRETDKYLINALSSLIEQYPKLAGPAVSVADRVFRSIPSEQIPEKYARNRPHYMKKRSIELLQDIISVAPEANLPMGKLYSTLGDPSESVREKTALLLATVADQVPDSLNSCRNVGLILRDHWEQETDDADGSSSADPLTVIAKHNSEESAELGRLLVAQTPTADLNETVELLRTMAEFAPEAVEPVLEEATGTSN